MSRPAVSRFYPEDGSRVITAINKIALEVAAAVASPRTTCPVCGCLKFTWESCPKCRLDAAAMHRRQA